MISRRSYRIANAGSTQNCLYLGKNSHRTPAAAARKRAKRRATFTVQTLVFIMGIALVFGADMGSLLDEATTHAATLQSPTTTIPDEPLTLE